MLGFVKALLTLYADWRKLELYRMDQAVSLEVVAGVLLADSAMSVALYWR